MFCTPPPHRFGERFMAMLRNPWLAWPDEPVSLAGRFNVALAYLCRLLGEHLDRRRDAGLTAQVMPAYHYLTRLTRRFIALAVRAQAGTLRPPPPRPPRSSPSPPPNPPPDPAAAAEPPPARPPGLPRGRGWLRRMVPTLAPAAGELHALLQHPEMLALVAMGPQTGRLLRPLCRALAVPLPDYLRLPPRPPRPPDPARHAARDAARAARRAEAAWARALRRRLGLPARPPADALRGDPPPRARPPPKPA